MITRVQVRYLRTLLELEESRVPPIQARVAERLGISAPTVRDAMRYLRERAFTHAPDRSGRFVLTARGRRLAVAALRRHRIVECFLHDVVALRWPDVHGEASRVEPVIGDDVIARMDQILAFPRHSPYGNPIPGWDDPDWNVFRRHQWATTDLYSSAAQTRGTGTRTIAWLGEGIQSDVGLLERLSRDGIVPGAQVRFDVHGQTVVAAGPHGPASTLPVAAATNVFVFTGEPAAPGPLDRPAPDGPAGGPLTGGGRVPGSERRPRSPG